MWITSLLPDQALSLVIIIFLVNVHLLNGCVIVDEAANAGDRLPVNLKVVTDARVHNPRIPIIFIADPPKSLHSRLSFHEILRMHVEKQDQGSDEKDRDTYQEAEPANEESIVGEKRPGI